MQMDETLSEWLTTGASAEEERSAGGALSPEDGVGDGSMQDLTLQQRPFVVSFCLVLLFVFARFVVNVCINHPFLGVKMVDWSSRCRIMPSECPSTDRIDLE